MSTLKEDAMNIDNWEESELVQVIRDFKQKVMCGQLQSSLFGDTLESHRQILNQQVEKEKE